MIEFYCVYALFIKNHVQIVVLKTKLLINWAALRVAMLTNSPDYFGADLCHSAI